MFLAEDAQRRMRRWIIFKHRIVALLAAACIQSLQGSRFSTASWITSVLHTEPYPRKSDYPFFRGLLVAHARLSLLSPLSELFQRSIKYFCQQFHSCLLCPTIRETAASFSLLLPPCRLCRRFCPAVEPNTPVPGRLFLSSQRISRTRGS